MLSPNKFDHIYFFRPYIDFRKGHRGLAGIVQDEKRGLYVYYSLTKKGKEITNLLFNIN